MRSIDRVARSRQCFRATYHTGMRRIGDVGGAVIETGFTGTVRVDALRRIGVTARGVLGSDGAWAWDLEQAGPALHGRCDRQNEVVLRNPALMSGAGQASSSLPTATRGCSSAKPSPEAPMRVDG